MASAIRALGRFANLPYNGLLIFALFQEETTGIAGVVNDAGDVAADASREPRSIFKGLGEFLQVTLAVVGIVVALIWMVGSVVGMFSALQDVMQHVVRRWTWELLMLVF